MGCVLTVCHTKYVTVRNREKNNIMYVLRNTHFFTNLLLQFFYVLPKDALTLAVTTTENSVALFSRKDS